MINTMPSFKHNFLIPRPMFLERHYIRLGSLYQIHCLKSNPNFRNITWNVVENMILHEIFRLASRLPATFHFISRKIDFLWDSVEHDVKNVHEGETMSHGHEWHIFTANLWQIGSHLQKYHQEKCEFSGTRREDRERRIASAYCPINESSIEFSG